MLPVFVETRSLTPEVKERIDKMWSELGRESLIGRRPNAAYGQSAAGKSQYEFLKAALLEMGVPTAEVREEYEIPFPGYFLPVRRWDLGVTQGKTPVALVEFKYFALLYKHKQNRASVLANELAFKALDLFLAMREAGIPRSSVFVGAFVQIFRIGRPDLSKNTRKWRHPKMYAWANTQQEAIRKSLKRLVQSGLYNCVTVMEANCINYRDVRWWSLPELDLPNFLYKLEQACVPPDGVAESETRRSGPD